MGTHGRRRDVADVEIRHQRPAWVRLRLLPQPTPERATGFWHGEPAEVRTERSGHRCGWTGLFTEDLRRPQPHFLLFRFQRDAGVERQPVSTARANAASE